VHQRKHVLSRTVYSASNNAVTLKYGLGVIRSYSIR